MPIHNLAQSRHKKRGMGGWMMILGKGIDESNLLNIQRHPLGFTILSVGGWGGGEVVGIL